MKMGFCVQRQIGQHHEIGCQFLDRHRLVARQRVIREHHRIGRQGALRNEIKVRRDFQIIGQGHVDLRAAQFFDEAELVTFDPGDLNTCVLLLELTPQRGQQDLREGQQTADVERTLNLAGNVIRKPVETARLPQNLACLLQKLPPGLGQAEPMSVFAHEERQAEFLFQLRDRRRDRWRGDVDPRAGLRDRAFLAHGDEVFQLSKGETQCHGATMPPRAKGSSLVGHQARMPRPPRAYSLPGTP